MEKGLCSETSKGTKVLEKSKWFRGVFGLKALRRPTSIGNGIRAPGRRGFQTISAESAPLPCAGVHVRQNRPSEPPLRRVHYGPQRDAHGPLALACQNLCAASPNRPSSPLPVLLCADPCSLAAAGGSAPAPRPGSASGTCRRCGASGGSRATSVIARRRRRHHHHHHQPSTSITVFAAAAATSATTAVDASAIATHSPSPSSSPPPPPPPSPPPPPPPPPYHSGQQRP